jgi:predicted nucleic acid-binding protein
MREIRLSGSEGGGKSRLSPYPYRAIQQIDMQIGAIARTLPNCIVVSKDADILVISGLTVENWAS